MPKAIKSSVLLISLLLNEQESYPVSDGLFRRVTAPATAGYLLPFGWAVYCNMSARLPWIVGENVVEGRYEEATNAVLAWYFFLPQRNQTMLNIFS